jgi:hypothetical protein
MFGPRTLLPLLALIVSTAVAQEATAPDDPPVETTRKNIKVLKGLPSSQLIPTMAFIANSLSVNCDYCHNTKDFASDEKGTKDVARAMIMMVRDINEHHFGGEPAVSCVTCHRGSSRPITTPSIASAFYNAPPLKPAPTLPPTGQVVDRFLHANAPLTDAHGTVSRSDGRSAPFTLHDGVVKTELAYPREANEALGPVALNKERAAVTSIAMIRGREAVVLEQRREKLYVDAQSGALLRRHRETQIELGPLPDEVDYDGDTITWSRGDERVVFKLEK